MFPFRKKTSPRETPAQRTGRLGEEQAAEFLRREKGFHIVQRNWRAGKDEIDLLAWDGPVLVLIEVKTRQTESLVPARVAVNRDKKAALRRAFFQYVKTLATRPRAVRFDIVEVYLAVGTPCPVRHYPNIPLFGKHFRS